MTAPLTLYADPQSTNCYKVVLIASHLRLPMQVVSLDILRGDTRTPDYLAKNPTGEVPMLEWADGRRLAESNAILVHLAEGTPWLPAATFARAETLRWLFFEQAYHENSITAARFWLSQVRGGRELKRDAIDQWLETGHRGLAAMERHLADHPYFGGDRPTVADIGLFAATCRAAEGDFVTDAYRAVTAWLARLEALPDHCPMPAPATGEARPA